MASDFVCSVLSYWGMEELPLLARRKRPNAVT